MQTFRDAIPAAAAGLACGWLLHSAWTDFGWILTLLGLTGP